jgi:hypothetical protein
MTLAPGTYTFTFNYVALTYALSADGFAEVFSTATAHNPAALLRVITAAELEARIEAKCKFSPFTFAAAPVPTIGKARAYAAHIELATLGHGRGYEVASEALGRDVRSLAALTLDELHQTLNLAYGSWGKTYNVAVGA